MVAPAPTVAVNGTVALATTATVSFTDVNGTSVTQTTLLVPSTLTFSWKDIAPDTKTAISVLTSGSKPTGSVKGEHALDAHFDPARTAYHRPARDVTLRDAPTDRDAMAFSSGDPAAF